MAEKSNHSRGRTTSIPPVHAHSHSHSYESKTRFVVILTFITMVVEIIFGYWTNSMALLADGFHTSVGSIRNSGLELIEFKRHHI
jgi:Co/Zn/Cd efflux system component